MVLASEDSVLQEALYNSLHLRVLPTPLARKLTRAKSARLKAAKIVTARAPFARVISPIFPRPRLQYFKFLAWR
ncbi:hypothetical protein B0T21DRAFT_374412 [Apiosordaria backusii]|uniref:Uncharacterized protein n=1 Tax=Apiosordaria backusii TaxID=314023 RepID=A0AA40AN63_9PEZI|nr:hypothetical protein B0T21DRAFT_374412 [Apiosordaria backusii]